MSPGKSTSYKDDFACGPTLIMQRKVFLWSSSVQNVFFRLWKLIDLLLKMLMINYFWQFLNSNLNINQIPMTESLHYCPLHINHDFCRVAWLLIHFVFISLQIWREYRKDKDCIGAVIPVCLIMILQWNCAINLLLTLQAGLKLLSVFVCYIPSVFVPVNY